MPGVSAFFEVVGLLATLVGGIYGVLQLRERWMARLIVHYWWELVLDPAQVKRARLDISVGLRHPDRSASDRYLRWVEGTITSVRQHDLPETHGAYSKLIGPAQKLPNDCKVWALRLLIFNPSNDKTVSTSDIDRIEISVGDSGSTPLSWQATDGRFDVTERSSASSDGPVFFLRIAHDLGPRHKVRDDLAVLRKGHGSASAPDVSVDLKSHIKSKIKAYRPATTYRRAVRRLLLRR